MYTAQYTLYAVYVKMLKWPYTHCKDLEVRNVGVNPLDYCSVCVQKTGVTPKTAILMFLHLSAVNMNMDANSLNCLVSDI